MMEDLDGVGDIILSTLFAIKVLANGSNVEPLKKSAK